MFFPERERADKSWKKVLFHSSVPCGLVVRIRRFHRRGRGSIPRMGVHFFSLLLDAILRNPGSRNGQTFRNSLRIKISLWKSHFSIYIRICMRKSLPLTHRIGGSVVECSPAIPKGSRPRAARVRFPADASFFFPSKMNEPRWWWGWRPRWRRQPPPPPPPPPRRRWRRRRRWRPSSPMSAIVGAWAGGLRGGRREGKGGAAGGGGGRAGRRRIGWSLGKKFLPGGESNPGLSRDRRGYLPLYYRGWCLLFDSLSKYC